MSVFIAVAFFFAVACSAGFDSNRVLLISEADIEVKESGKGNPDASLLRVGLRPPGENAPATTDIKVRAFLKFDISDIPGSGWFDDVVIDGAKLRLFGPSTSEPGRYLVTVGGCRDSDWEEATLKWQDPVCDQQSSPLIEDTVLVDSTDLPRTYEWDVRRAVRELRESGLRRVTFVVTARRLRDAEQDQPEATEGFGGLVGLVHFWSREQSNFGNGVMPTLIIDSVSAPTDLRDFVTSTLPAIAAVVAVGGGIYSLTRRFPREKS